MVKAVRFHRTGGAEVLQLEDIQVPSPGPGEVTVQHQAIGLNFADTYFRKGTYPVPLPSGIGTEASGSISAVGEGVTGLSIGDRVTYTGFVNTLGAYSMERNAPASAMIKLPAGVSCETAAAMTMRGLTAAYLMRRIHPFTSGETILVHAAAGGLGLILCQWAKLLGLRVIGVVSNADKAAMALANGCSAVVDSSKDEIASTVRSLTDGNGVDVAFDSVGRATFMASLDSLRRRGLMVCVGTASGTINAFDPNLLAMKGSLYLTRPALADYIADPAERQALADELFGHVMRGDIVIQINQRYTLEQAVQAHRDLEGRKTTGSSIFVV